MYGHNNFPQFYAMSFRRSAVLLIILAAFFLRTFQLDQQSLRGDEAATVLYSAMPVTELWELSRITDPHPPLYYAMLHPWQWLIGEQTWVMRFAGVIASTLAVAILYRLARQTLHTAVIGLLAAALLAVNPLQIWLAQDVRSYPFFTLFGLLSSWALWTALTTPPQSTPSAKDATTAPHSFHVLRFISYVLRFSPWLLYVLLTTACLYIHYYTVFLIAFQGLFALLNSKRFWMKKWPWLISQITIGLLIVPGLCLAYNFIGPAAGGIEKIPTLDILRLASTALLTGFTIEDEWGTGISLILAPTWIFGVFILLRRDFVSGSFWTLFFAGPVLGVIGLSIDRPFFKERFLVQAQPAFELLLAAGLVALAQLARAKVTAFTTTDYGSPPTPASSRLTVYALSTASFLLLTLLITLLILANAFALTNYFTNTAYAKAPPWHLYRDYLNGKFESEDVMLTNFPEAAISYYSPQGLPFYVVPVERDRSVAFRLAETQKIANAYERIWFLPLLKQGFDEHGDVLHWLDRHADRVDQVFFPAYHLNLYLGPSTVDAMLIPQPTEFAHGIALRGFQVFDKKGKSRLIPPHETEPEYLLRLEPGDEFTLSLYWLAGGPTEQPYTVFTHLIAADGFNRVGQDNQPVWGTYPTTEWTFGEEVTDKYTLTVPPGTPPGDHRLRVGWYQSGTQARVPVLNDRGEPVADHILLKVMVCIEQQK